MADVQIGCLILTGCIISAGSVLNHASMCCDGVHVDCHATVEGYYLVFAGTKVCSGEVYRRKDTIKAENLFFNPQKWEEQLANISRRASMQ